MNADLLPWAMLALFVIAIAGLVGLVVAVGAIERLHRRLDKVRHQRDRAVEEAQEWRAHVLDRGPRPSPAPATRRASRDADTAVLPRTRFAEVT